MSSSEHSNIVVALPYIDNELDDDPTREMYKTADHYERDYKQIMTLPSVDNMDTTKFSDLSKILNISITSVGEGDDAGIHKDNYSLMGNHDFEVSLKLTDNKDGETIETPLQMYQYVVPIDDDLNDPEKWQLCDMENTKRSAHNKLILMILNKFVKKNGCSTSVNCVVGPAEKPEIGLLRDHRLKDMLGDQNQRTQKAIQYLCEHHKKYCYQDYDYDDAVEFANKMSYEAAIKKLQDKGRFRIAVPGCPPTWWDGISRQCEDGYCVRFKRGQYHTFMFPQITFERYDEEEQLLIQ